VFQNQANKIPILEDSIEEDVEEEQIPMSLLEEVFAKGRPPKRLDFKFEALKPEYKNLLIDGS
jgi:hypothetical protein